MIVYLMVIMIGWMMYKYSWPIKIIPYEDSFSEESKCPACFGSSMCPFLHSGDLHLSGFSAWTLARTINVKNVFYGFWKSRNISVVIKKLGYDTELDQLDQHLCELVQQEHSCDVVQAVQKLTVKLGMTMKNKEEKEIGRTNRILPRLDWEKLKSMQLFSKHDWAQCMEQAQLDYLTTSSLLHHSTPILPHLLTMLLHNQEPLLAMTFSPKASWPFPSFLGSCGRLAVFSNAGLSLSTFIASSWLVRAGLALQLLKLATMFSKNMLAIAIYPTDWTADNFAVDSDGMITLVDLENIVLVNQTMLEILMSSGWDKFYTSDNYGCPNNECFSFSPTSLCTHVMTDHNYHGVCGNLLSPSPYSSNLLHSIPKTVIAKHKLLPKLLERCWKGGGEGGRVKAAKNIEDILTEELDL